MRVSETERSPDTSDGADPRDVLRALGDPRPPRDVVVSPPAASTPDVATPTQPPDEPGRADDVPSDPDLDAIAARLDRAEELARISSLEEAKRVLEETGGIRAVRALAAQLERDRAVLADLDERTARLRDRAAVDVPVEDLARLV